MYSYTRHGPHKGTALLAVLQAILLLSALVLTPAASIARDDTPSAEPTPAAETTGEPAAEPTPAPKAEAKAAPKPKAQAESKTPPKRERTRSTAPKVAPKVAPKPAAKTLGEQGLTIRFFPQKVKIALGGNRVVGAYLCDKDDKTPFGGAKSTGDPKDYCDPVRVKWTIDGTGATIPNKWGKKTKVTLIGSQATRLIATVDDLKRPTKIIVKQKAAKNRPEALTPEQIKAAQAAKQPKAPETQPTADEPKADEPKADEPKAEEPKADEPKADEPKAEEPKAEEPKAEEPKAEEPKAEEPKAEEPKAEEPKAEERDCLVDPVSGECLVELPERDLERTPEQPVEEAPAEETTEEPTAAPAEDDAADCLVDPVSGECLVEQPESRLEQVIPTETESEPVPAAVTTKTIAPAAIEPAAAGDPGVGGSASLDQCANGGVGDPPTGCDANNDWVNGNLNQSKANYAEGDTIPYRMLLGGLSTGGEIHALTIEWDTTKGGLHAIDYITSYDQTESTANPCAGSTPCSGSSDDTISIPADPQVTSAGVTPIAGALHIWGGDFTSISGYSYSTGSGFAGDKKASITVFFTADQASPVISWGGHIASRIDWGIGNAAGTISGSPYHMRLISINDKGGNQDRSLSANAVYLLNQLTIIKVADPGNTGTAFDFTASGDFAPTSFSLQHGGSRVFGPHSQDTSGSITESAETNWTLTDIICGVEDANGGSQNVSLPSVDVSMNEGEIVTCTFYNELQDSNLTLVKKVTNDNGGTADASAWTLTATGGGGTPINGSGSPASGTTASISADVTAGVQYTLSESGGPSGYSSDGTWVCTGDGTFVSPNKITLSGGESAECTIVNDDDAPSLILKKLVNNFNGGTTLASAWTLYANNTDGDNSVPGSVGGNEVTDQVGTYQLSESGPSNYTRTSLTCDNNAGVEVTEVTIGLGETITCRFVNDDDAPSLKLVKVLDFDNGGTAVESDFTLNAGAFSTAGSATPVEVTDQVGTYALSEDAVSGYTLDSIVCDDDPGVPVTSVDLGLGESITCTFTNSDDAPGLKLVKVLDFDNGGTAVESDFTLNAGAFSTAGSATPVEVTDQVGTYALSEDAVSGYTLDSIVCDDDPGVPVTSVDLGLGESITCTFTNSDDAPGLKLVKVLDFDNGGTAVESDFTLNAGAFSTAGSATPVEVTDQVGTYALSEDAVSGYTLDSIVCDDDPGVPVTSVDLGLGESITCTFTNSDDAPGLKLVKVLDFDNGGTAVESDFTLNAGAFSTAGSATPVEVTDQVGTYALSEDAVSGYTLDSIVCDDDPGVPVTSVDLGLGESITCTFTNSDDAPGLKLVKVLDFDNGGTAVESDFTLNAGAFSTAGSATPVEVTDQVGTYALSEDAVSGYTLDSIVCDDDPGVPVTSVDLGLGESITCTFTNSDDAPGLKLVKTVVGGPAAEADFQANIDTVGDVDWDAAIPVDAGSHVASESWTIDDYVGGDWGGDCDADGNVTIALGEDLECTISNYYASLDIEKSADPAFYAEVGDVINYTITATNNGFATLNGVDVTDEFPAGLDDFTCQLNGAGDAITLPYDGLIPSDYIECTASHTIVQADIDAGSVYNQACVDADEITAEGEICDDETVLLSELEIVKSADVDFYNAVGDEIVYTVIATNTGELELTNVDISDSLIADIPDWTCDPTTPVASLASGASIECTGTYTIDQADIAAGSVTNAACADSTQTAEVCDDVETPLAQLEIVKSASPDTYSAVGDEIVYTVTATNTGEATLENVDVSDALIDGLDSWACQVGDAAATLPVSELLSGQSITCTATYAITADDITGSKPQGSVLNTACADSDQTPEVCDEVQVDEIVIQIFKTVTPTVLAEPGGVFTYTLEVDNDSVVPLTITELIDDNSGLSPDWAANCATLVGTVLAPDQQGPADEATCTYTVERTVAGVYPNVAQVTGTDTNNRQTTAEDDVTVTVLSSEITIEKTADVDYFTAVGDEIVYTVTATNTGEAELTNVDISDSLIADIPDWTCDPTTPVATLAPAAQIICTGTYTIDQADFDAGSVTNAACADSTQTDEICDEVDTPLAELEIEKTADVDYFTAVGDEIVYTVTATNTGEAELTNVDISDSLIADIPDWTCDPTTPVATLAPAAQIICTGTYTVDQADFDAGSVTNAACADSTQTDEICDEVDTPLAELEIEKTSNFQSYSAVGDEVVYTIVATNTGVATLTDVDVSDELIDELGSWQCTPDIPATLAAGESVTCSATYTITQADIDAGSVLNTACVDSNETDEVCDDNTVNLLSVTLIKTANPTSVFVPGEDVTFTLTYEHPVTEFDVYLYSLTDDVFGDVLDAGNPDVTDNTCLGSYGTLLAPNTPYTCEFTGFVAGEVGDLHVNTATVAITDVDPAGSAGQVPPRFATASDTAEVGFLAAEVEPTPLLTPTPKPTPTLAPTDMLPFTDSYGSGGDNDPMGGLLNWAIWLMLSALLIVGTALLIRREKLAEVNNR